MCGQRRSTAADKLLDELVVLGAANALVLPANIDRVVQPRFVVRAHVEQNRQAVLRRNAAQRGVERHLADGNAHAARALIAQAENALAVRDHDAAHLVKARVGEDLLDAVLLRIAEKKPARPAPDLAEALAALAHRGRIDNGQQLFGVVLDQRVEERFAVVLQVAHVAVLEKSGVAAVQNPLAALPLVFQACRCEAAAGHADRRRRAPLR